MSRPADLVDASSEDSGPRRLRSVFCDKGKELVHPLQPEAGAEGHGIELAGADEAGDLPVRYGTRLHVGFEGVIVQHGQGLLIRRGKGHAALAKALLQVLHELLPAEPRGVHLGHENKGGHPGPKEQGPEGLRVGLDAVGAADDQDGHVHGRDGSLRFSGQVRVARCVEDGQLQLAHLQTGLFGEDGDPPIPLQGMGIQERVPVIHPTQLSEHPGFIEQRFAKGGLPRVHMGQNARRYPLFPLVVVHAVLCYRVGNTSSQ